ncbi:hypothetical protein AO287_21275 [Pseudomonas savastanoi]|uniref:Uncharacterized protein n=1 Tax=Pseudomonas savastanoi TaxID=29438 RepID=A0AAW3LV34_PSESS|nr:hypothetical protein AO287_21275 [Pseudomonas savastanoi]
MEFMAGERPPLSSGIFFKTLDSRLAKAAASLDMALPGCGYGSLRAPSGGLGIVGQIGYGSGDQGAEFSALHPLASQEWANVKARRARSK